MPLPTYATYKYVHIFYINRLPLIYTLLVKVPGGANKL